MPVISSWKYAGACESLKGTLTYSYLPNGELNAVFGVEDLSRGILLYNILLLINQYSSNSATRSCSGSYE